MGTIQDIQSNIKLNLNYIINADDNFKVIISKIIQKLKDNDADIYKIPQAFFIFKLD